ncbi:putative RNA methyltransferase-domain-containing protein [Bombardia bombarda]|uniref:RNA methyltransferase-domain-containing protein n=1 Tax=Bombardia bombarda TaxID=252184 RepID=A0AA39X6T5_9PEZI|nr:putative RNA methyltransferase-domain-containing protein [Bombardia bombarda]
MAPGYEHQAKRRRVDGDGGNDGNVNDFKPPRFLPTIPRDWTISVAVPTSIIGDCTTREQRTTYAGRIARLPPRAVDQEAYTGDIDPAHFLEHLLTYLETPPFMRKTLFPLHPNLRSQGLLPSLDMPHHPHKDEWLPYREGMTLDTKTKDGKGTLVDIGMGEPVTIAESIPPRTRLTLKMPDSSTGTPEPVHPTAPRTDSGYFWGYTVRKAATLSNVFTDSPYEDGYDISIGTSERGQVLGRAFPDYKKAVFSHLLVAFGGPRGLEFAAMNDPELSELGIGGSRTKELFDHWVNVLPNQGSRNIRTDEAMLIALTGLRRLWDAS